LVPSFLKALYITSEDTIFDDDAALTGGNSIISLGLKSLTHSAEGAVSQPEAMKLRIQEMNRSKSALSSNAQNSNQLDAPQKQF